MTWVLWNLVSVHLEIVLVLVQDRRTICAKRTIGLDIIFNAPMVILGDKAQVKAPFSPFGDCANLVARSFWMHPMELLGDMGHVKSHFGLFGDSVGVGAI